MVRYYLAQFKTAGNESFTCFVQTANAHVARDMASRHYCYFGTTLESIEEIHDFEANPGNNEKCRDTSKEVTLNRDN
jgi:hypothetical protein